MRATQRDELEWLELIPALVDEWETTSVEFKRRLDLSTREGRGEFVHDVIALATTKASGRRFLVIGFDEATHRFAEGVDASVYQDRIEQILNRYAEPIPDIRHRTLGWESGTIGVLEVHRDPAKVPYRFKRDVGRYHAGDVFVRHGSQIEPPTAAELASLEAEGNRARAEPG